jgi:pimeloyl-ACP methyl ester carboxylesterase
LARLRRAGAERRRLSRGFALALTLSLAAGAAGAQDRMVRLPDHRRIHLYCEGHGKVTAILESGFAADSGAWYLVQPKLAKTMRVCSYDRAGAGRSDPGPYPRDGAAIARDLDQALRAAGIRGPFIGVGHSAGGLYMRVFAAQRRADMKGLVLVDPSIEHAAGAEGIRAHSLACQHFVEKTPVDRKDWHWDSCIPKKPELESLFLRPETWKTQVSEIETLFTTTSDEVDAAAARVRNVQTIILTAEQGGMAPFHARMARRFAHAEQRIVPSGHMMFFDQPQAIVQAVEDLARR